MRLELEYRTDYRYTPAVRSGVTVLRMRPRERPNLHVITSSVESEGGATGAWYVDAWGTLADIVEFPDAHTEAAFIIRASVETLSAERDIPPTAYERFAYTSASARVPEGAVAGLDWGLVDPLSWAAVESVLQWFPQRFRYQVGVTEAGTSIHEFLAQGTGVCQDFAHVLLGLLREWGWCARYVSGYSFKRDDDAAITLDHAMHAWVEVYRPGIGWAGLDPTAGAYTHEGYVPVGYGRDYEDVRPVRGVLVGRDTRQSQSAQLVLSAKVSAQ